MRVVVFRRGRATLLMSTTARFQVRVLEPRGLDGGDLVHGQGLCFHGVVGGDMGRLVGVAFLGGGMQTFEAGGLTEEEPTETGVVTLADGLAVPARAFAVDLVEHFLVGLAGPFERVRELVLVDLVVVVDEYVGCLDRKVVVLWRRQLVRVPSQIEVEGGYGDVIRMLRQDGEIPVVLRNQTLHSRRQGW